jgi:hypothetical protein
MRPVKARGLRRISPYCLALLIACPQLFVQLPASADQVPGAGDANSSQSANVSQTKDIPLFTESPIYSLPALEPSPFTMHPILENAITLHGFVTFTKQIASPVQLIDHLVGVALARDRDRELLERKKRFHDKKLTRFWGRTKDMVQYMTDYQGFESSSEAADVILEEKLKLKHRAAVEFVRQKRLDAAHLQLTCAVMQVAMALGMKDEAKREQAIDSGREVMVPLIGAEESTQTVQDLAAWSKSLQVPESSFMQDPWDVVTQRKKTVSMLVCSLHDDDVVKSIEARLHRYNHISNFSRVTSKVVNTSLSIIAFSPTFASPAAQAAQFVYVACTGGPEEKKLLKEVYLDRCFESRFERLDQEIGLTVNNYNNAIATHNPVLFSCTRLMMEGMTSPDTVDGVINEAQPAGAKKAFGERI